jgi:hypothetical protein
MFVVGIQMAFNFIAGAGTYFYLQLDLGVSASIISYN